MNFIQRSQLVADFFFKVCYVWMLAHLTASTQFGDLDVGLQSERRLLKIFYWVGSRQLRQGKKKAERLAVSTFTALLLL